MATSTPRTGRGERFAREGDRPAARRSARRRMTETRPAFTTTEFYAYVAATLGVLIAGLVTDGAGDTLSAGRTWLIVGILTGAYMISRGLAKAGNAEQWVPGRDDQD
jgi:hypothetical protein